MEQVGMNGAHPLGGASPLLTSAAAEPDTPSRGERWRNLTKS